MFGSFLIYLGATAVLIYILCWILQERNLAYWRAKGADVIPTGSLLKIMLTGQFSVIKMDPVYYEQIKKTGKGFAVMMRFGSPEVFITDLDLVREITVKAFDHFTDLFYVDLKDADPHMHYTLFNMRGQEWKNLRHAITPTFTTGRIRRMYDIFESSSRKLTNAIGKETRSGKVVDIRPLVKRVTLNVIASAAFGVETNLFEDPNSVFMKMGAKISQTFTGINVIKMIMLLTMPKIAKLLKLRLTDETADGFLSQLIKDSLKYRKESGKGRDDFLQLMLESRESQPDGCDGKVEITDDVIIAQAVTFILGGFDTTEVVLNAVFYELAVNPDVQEKLVEAILSALGAKHSLDYDIVNSLEYLDMIISETLRKYPPASRIQRICTSPYKIPGSEFVVPKDTTVVLQVFALHRDPKYWPEPERFDPLRFTKENMAKRHPMSYLPFGTGPRHCIGNRFAQMVMKVVVANIILKYKLEPCDKTDIPLRLSETSPQLRPEGSIWLSFQPRKSD